MLKSTENPVTRNSHLLIGRVEIMSKFIELEDMETGKPFLLNTEHIQGIGYYDRTEEKGSTIYLSTFNEKIFVTIPYSELKLLLKSMIINFDY